MWGIGPNSTRDAAADWVESENRRREGEEGKGGGDVWWTSLCFVFRGGVLLLMKTEGEGWWVVVWA